jgi:hypothetical protein
VANVVFNEISSKDLDRDAHTDMNNFVDKLEFHTRQIKTL